MRKCFSLPRTSSDFPPVALTVGMFDGVHRGHRFLLERLCQVASDAGAVPAVVTFSNHPLSILSPNLPSPSLLTSLEEKLFLLEECGVELALAVPFTKEVAEMTYEEFLAPFSLTHLLLGRGARFGKNLEGTEENLLRLSQERGFCLEYVEKVSLLGEVVSSRRIRAALAQGDQETALHLLGRSLAPR